MRILALSVALGLLISCGGGEEPPDATSNVPAKGPEKPPENTPDPDPDPDPDPGPSKDPEYGKAGKTATKPLFACPEDGCTFTDPRGGKCLKHKDTDMKEQYFVCKMCSVKETQEGKCSKCGMKLERTLQ